MKKPSWKLSSRSLLEEDENSRLSASNPETHSLCMRKDRDGGRWPRAICIPHPLHSILKSSNVFGKKNFTEANTWARGCRPAVTCELVLTLGHPSSYIIQSDSLL
ncbi:hypothetical protein TNCT_732321 [Trichonephila clavata]|uniref:Uncharacterized protein n=1 Tax=Trichonephila clavata TaxID=2740835 RepID=A0A8X6HSV7_TRICU|nr:hypothetical protein TNCT_732321 [Trichonephila clavata]